MGGLFHRQGSAQRPHGFRERRCPRNEPPRCAGGHFARQRQDVLRRVGSQQSAAVRFALFLPRDLRRGSQYDGPNDQGSCCQGGVIQINYHVGFLSQEFRDAEKANPELEKEIQAEINKRCGDNDACQLVEGDRVVREYMTAGKLPRVDYTKIIEHIDHAVKLAGAEHVGLGSDFDGAMMPFGMEDATKLPKITEALLQKGYSEGDVKKILGENTLRVMTEVERVSRELNAGK